MAPRRRANCQICNGSESKYACPGCEVLYCSVSCYKQHKRSSCGASTSADMGANASPANTATTNTENARVGPGHDDILAVSHGVKRESDAVSDSRSELKCESRLLLETDKREGEGDASPSPSAHPRDSSPHVRQAESFDVSAGSSHVCAVAETARKDDNELELELELEQLDESRRDIPGPEPESLDEPRPLRKLSSLKWPYVPDAPSYPDPLTRDDPKPLSLAQYEAIARSPAIRRALSSHPRLPALLRSLDALRGPAREQALERTLGVAPSQASFSLAIPGLPPSASASYSTSNIAQGRRNIDEEAGMSLGVDVDEEDMKALRALAEAVEAAVRNPVGSNDVDGRFGVDPLGLDWETMEV